MQSHRRAIRYGVISLVVTVSGTALVGNRIDRTIDHRLTKLMSERVIWQCNECGAIQLIPITGQNYQPRNWAPLDDIPKTLVDAVIAVEDRRFYTHRGIDLYRMCGALVAAIKRRERPRGTSTLTQQLARTVFTMHERTFARKFREGVIALELERRFSKRYILELYLNTVPFGNAGPYEIVGVADASVALLGVRLADLNPAGIALLAGMIQRPSYLNPRTRPAAASRQRDLVLKLLRKRGVISVEQEDEARQDVVNVAALQSERAHYLQLAARELGNMARAGKPVEVTLTMDAELQYAASQALQRGVERLNKQLVARGGKVEAALVAIDPRTGAVRALVGGSNFLTSQVNRALSRRQPGSVFKPFVYAAAFEYGSRNGALGPYSEVNDIPRKFRFNGANYEPHNFGSVYHGRVTLQQALQQSLNIPAVRLAEVVGYERVSQMARVAGLEGVASTPSAALGSYEVSLLALAGAYTAFAHDGVAMRPYFIERVRDWEGSTLYQASMEGERVMKAETAQAMAGMLRGVVQHGTAYTAGRLPFAAAGKTGTDDDGWFVGFADRLLCAVWVGYDDNQNLKLEGAESALPIWIDFMSAASKMKTYRFGNQLEVGTAQWGAHDVDPPLPDDFDLDELILTVGARLALNVNATP